MINVRVFDLYAYIKDPVESGRHYSFRYGNSGLFNNAIICDNDDYDNLHPGQWPCNCNHETSLNLCLELWNHELMDECLQKLALCYTPFRESGPGLFRVFSSVMLLMNVLSTGSGIQSRSQGVASLTALTTGWWCPTAARRRNSAIIQVSLRDINRACARYFVLFQTEK